MGVSVHTVEPGYHQVRHFDIFLCVFSRHLGSKAIAVHIEGLCQIKCT